MADVTRRETLMLAAGSALAIAGVPLPVTATPNEAAAAIAKFTGGKTPEAGKIAIDLPEIAENGNTVPMSVNVDSPMTVESYVSDIFIVAEANPRPEVVTFRFTPMSGRAEAATRIRLNGTGDVIVIAKTSDGKLYTARKPVKVTIGGCGG
jgi:sulfur-oxidizing protein SoxY